MVDHAHCPGQNVVIRSYECRRAIYLRQLTRTSEAGGMQGIWHPIYVGDIDMYIPLEKPNTYSHANCMQHVLGCLERQSDCSEYKKTLRRPGLHLSYLASPTPPPTPKLVPTPLAANLLVWLETRNQAGRLCCRECVLPRPRAFDSIICCSHVSCRAVRVKESNNIIQYDENM